MNEFVCEIRSGSGADLVWTGVEINSSNSIDQWSLTQKSISTHRLRMSVTRDKHHNWLSINRQFHLIHFFGVWNWQHRFHTRRILNNEINHLVVTCFFSEYEFDFEITQLIDLNTSASFKTKKIVFFPLLLSDVCNRPIFILTSLKRTIIKCQWV